MPKVTWRPADTEIGEYHGMHESHKSDGIVGTCSCCKGRRNAVLLLLLFVNKWRCLDFSDLQIPEPHLDGNKKPQS